MHKYNDKNGVIHAIVYGNSVIFWLMNLASPLGEILNSWNRLSADQKQINKKPKGLWGSAWKDGEIQKNAAKSTKKNV